MKRLIKRGPGDFMLEVAGATLAAFLAVAMFALVFGLDIIYWLVRR